MHINNILVLTELNHLSEKLIEFATALARELGIRNIVLLNLVLPTLNRLNRPDDPLNEWAQRSIHSNLKKNLAIVKQLANKHNAFDIKIIPHVKLNREEHNLKHYTRQFQADLVICSGTDNYKFWEHYFGSEDQLKLLEFPLIVFNEDTVSHSIRNIALAIDVLKDDQEGIDDIIGFAEMLKAHLQLVYIETQEEIDSEDAIEKLHKLARNKNIHNYSLNVISNYNVESGLQGFVRSYKPDMVAVLSRGKGKLHQLIYGNHGKDNLKETELPVLICGRI
jgi:nucleotide-binding universal stress UspA family protein